MDFEKLIIFGTYISKEYSREFFRLLVTYKDISASEAASRLEIHIKTAQDFLEGMSEAGILIKTRVTDRTRPYYRYSLEDRKPVIRIDFESLAGVSGKVSGTPALREKMHSGARFTTSRYGSSFTSVVIPVGAGRSGTARKINLTPSQGMLLFQLPFPGAEPLTLEEMMRRAGLGPEALPELNDIINLLAESEIIETIY